MESLKAVIDKYYLFIGLILLVAFVLSERYLMPDGMKFGSGDVNNLKGLLNWFQQKKEKK